MCSILCNIPLVSYGEILQKPDPSSDADPHASKGLSFPKFPPNMRHIGAGIVAILALAGFFEPFVP